MKKFQLWLFSALIVLLQSCSVNTNMVYHKDATQSAQIDVYMKELMDFAKSMKSDSADASHDKLPKDFEKMPKTWKSLYDMQLEDTTKVIKNKDSIALLKKIFMKSNFSTNGKELEGVSIKWDKLSAKEINDLVKKKKDSTGIEDRITSSNVVFQNWDGKTLIIDTEKLKSTEALEELGKSEEKTEPTKPVYKYIKTKKGTKKVLVKQKETPEELAKKSAEQMKMMFKMFNMSMKNTLKFESKIIHIEGKHDWVKQIDDHTIQIDLDSKEMFDKKDFIHKDPKVIITTE